MTNSTTGNMSDTDLLLKPPTAESLQIQTETTIQTILANTEKIVQDAENIATNNNVPRNSFQNVPGFSQKTDSNKLQQILNGGNIKQKPPSLASSLIGNTKEEIEKVRNEISQKYIQFYRDNVQQMQSNIDWAWRVKSGLYLLGGASLLISTTGFPVPVYFVIVATSTVGTLVDDIIIRGKPVLVAILENIASLSLNILFTQTLPNEILSSFARDSLLSKPLTYFGIGVITTMFSRIQQSRNVIITIERLLLSNEVLEEIRIREYVRRRIDGNRNFGYFIERSIRDNKIAPLQDIGYSMQELTEIATRLRSSGYRLTDVIGKYDPIEFQTRNKGFMQRMYQIAITSGLTNAILNTIIQIQKESGLQENIGRQFLIAGSTRFTDITWHQLVKPVATRIIANLFLTSGFSVYTLLQNLKRKIPITSREERAFRNEYLEKISNNIAFRYAWNFLWESSTVSNVIILNQIIGAKLNIPAFYTASYFQGFSLAIEDQFSEQMKIGTILPEKAIKLAGENYEIDKDIEMIDLQNKASERLGFGFFISETALLARREWTIKVLTKEIDIVNKISLVLNERIKQQEQLDVEIQDLRNKIDTFSKLYTNGFYNDLLQQLPSDIYNRVQPIYNEMNPNVLSRITAVPPSFQEFSRQIQEIISSPEYPPVAEEFVDNIIAKSDGLDSFWKNLGSSSIHNNAGIQELKGGLFWIAPFYRNADSMKAYIELEGELINYFGTLKEELNKKIKELGQLQRDNQDIARSRNLYQDSVLERTRKWYESAKDDQILQGIFDPNFSIGFQPSSISQAENLLQRANKALLDYKTIRGLSNDFPKIQDLFTRNPSEIPQGDAIQKFQYHADVLERELQEFDGFSSEQGVNVSTLDAGFIPLDVLDDSSWISYQKSILVGKRLSLAFIDSYPIETLSDADNQRIAFLLILYRNPIMYKRIMEKNFNLDWFNNPIGTFHKDILQDANQVFKTLDSIADNQVPILVSFLEKIRFWGVEHVATVRNLDLDPRVEKTFGKIIPILEDEVKLRESGNAIKILKLEEDVDTMQYIREYKQGIYDWIRFSSERPDAQRFVPVLYKVALNQPISIEEESIADEIVSRFKEDAKIMIWRLASIKAEFMIPYLVGNREGSAPSLMQRLAFLIQENRGSGFNPPLIWLNNVQESYSNYLYSVFGIRNNMIPESLMMDTQIQNVLEFAKLSGTFFDVANISPRELAEVEKNEFNLEDRRNEGDPTTTLMSMWMAALGSVSKDGKIIQDISNIVGKKTSTDCSINLGELVWKLQKRDVLPRVQSEDVVGGMLKPSLRKATDLTKILISVVKGEPEIVVSKKFEEDNEILRTIVYGRSGSLVRYYNDRYLQRILYSQNFVTTQLNEYYYGNLQTEYLKRFIPDPITAERFKYYATSFNELQRAIFGSLSDEKYVTFGVTQEPFNDIVEDNIIEPFQSSLTDRFLQRWNSIVVLPSWENARLGRDSVISFLNPGNWSFSSIFVGATVVKYTTAAASAILKQSTTSFRFK